MSGKQAKGKADPVDEETKAKLKAEKEARRALFEQSKGAEIAAQKANKTKGKQKGKQQDKPATSGGNAVSQADAAVPAQVTRRTSDAKLKEERNAPPLKPGSPKPAAKQPSSQQNSSKQTAKVDEVTEGVKSMSISDKQSNEKEQKTVKPTVTACGTKPVKVQKLTSRVHTLFDHLPKGIDTEKLFEETKGSSAGLDPGFLALGLKYSQGQIQGSNKRVIALLEVVKKFIESYVTPEGTEFKYGIAASFKQNLLFLRKCRPFAVAMNNTVEFIHGKFRELETTNDSNIRSVKDELISSLHDFEEEKIKKAVEAIRYITRSKIVTNDVVLVFGYSELVTQIIADASKRESFSLVIVDGRPFASERRSKGLDIMNNIELNTAGSGTNGVQLVKYASITGLSNVIRGVTKVLLGAHALLTNGGVLSHAGTSEIALIANRNNIPVIVCCETLKFCDKCPTDSFFLNEIGTGFGLRKQTTEPVDPAIEPYLVTPVIKYDLTPAELVTAVITDIDILPSTSVPAVLRVQESRPIR